MLRKLLLVAFFATVSASAFAQDNPPIVTESTSDSNVTTTTTSETTVNSPPPTAASPSINASNTDLCTVGISGAVQTQILGISGGSTVRDMNCERLKLSKTLYDMGMKVAAVSVMCQDERIFEAMKMAGTPCPFEGKIGPEAAELWEQNPQMTPEEIRLETEKDAQSKKRNITLLGVLLTVGLVIGL